MKNIKKKKIIVSIVLVLCIFGTQLVTVWAGAGSVSTVLNGDKPYAPINTIVTQMGGTVQRNEADKYTMVIINDKTVRVDDTWGFAEINGEFTPYETTVCNNWTVPTYKKPIIKEGISYVPVSFLTEKLGLDLKISGDTVTFTSLDKEIVKVATTPSTNNTESTSKNVETNRPANNKNTNTNTNNTNTNTTTEPQAQEKPQEPVKQTTKTYTGSQVKQQLYGLGFVNYGDGLLLNQYGADGNSEYDYMSFKVLSGNSDMYLVISNSNPEVDQKIRTLLNYILPSQGGTLYSILDNPNCQSQTLQLDGRSINIGLTSYGVTINFGPIIK